MADVPSMAHTKSVAKLVNSRRTNGPWIGSQLAARFMNNGTKGIARHHDSPLEH